MGSRQVWCLYDLGATIVNWTSEVHYRSLRLRPTMVSAESDSYTETWRGHVRLTFLRRRFFAK